MPKKDKESLSCLSCGLRDQDHIVHGKIEPYGLGKKGILVIGEAPGSVENKRGLPWQGQTGRLLQRTMAKLGIDLFEDCVSVNAVNCQPYKLRAPKPFEIDCCRAVMVEDAIDAVNYPHGPKVIILLGTVAIQSFLSPRWPSDLGGIMKWRGFTIPDRDYGCWVVPAYHPSYVSRIDSREANTVWEQDLARAIACADKPFPKFPEPSIQYIEDLDVLNSFHELPEIAFDYETTGLKSHKKGHRIVCASIAVGPSLVYAFMLPPTKAERKPFIDLLMDHKVGKMAHNMKFELAWTQNRLRTEVQNWQWDSMLAAHIIDNRSGTTGLKFQTYVNFGVIDYSSEITPYLRSDGTGNGFNKIMDLVEEEGGKEKLLKYCALDSHYEYNLAKSQMELLGYSYLPF